VFSWLVALAVSVAAAVWLSAFLERDSCLDAGGVYHAASGGCEVVRGGEYVAQLARPSLYLLWAIFLALVFVPGWLAWRLLKWVVDRNARPSA
jgi:hypothetical protein